MMKGKIEIKGMGFHAFHGCYPGEKADGNDFSVDVSFLRDIGKAAASDRLEDTTDCSAIYDIVAEEMGKPSNLLENVASRIMSAIRTRFPELEGITVRVAKKNPPLNGTAEESSVTVKDE